MLSTGHGIVFGRASTVSLGATIRFRVACSSCLALGCVDAGNVAAFDGRINARTGDTIGDSRAALLLVVAGCVG